jgi:hypothetical protein
MGQVRERYLVGQAHSKLVELGLHIERETALSAA